MSSELFFDASSALATMGRRHGDRHFQGKWSDKHWMNTPGPLYCGQTDNCGTGPLQAPNNVQVDKDGYEVIFRQPANSYELHQVVQAAWCDPLSGYGADGNEHWSYELVKSWWAMERHEVERTITREYEEQIAPHAMRDYNYLAGLTHWLDYLNGEIDRYLRSYAFFLDNRRGPTEVDALPDW
jgi:hypothetical protein